MNIYVSCLLIFCFKFDFLRNSACSYYVGLLIFCSLPVIGSGIKWRKENKFSAFQLICFLGIRRLHSIPLNLYAWNICKFFHFFISILQDSEIVDMCLRALRALASYHYKETGAGKLGLGAQAGGLNDSNGNPQEGILSSFLHSLLQLLLFEDYR